MPRERKPRTNQINPGIEVSRLDDVLPLALVLQTDLQVPVGPGDEGCAVSALHGLVQAEVELERNVGDPFLEQKEGRGQWTTWKSSRRRWCLEIFFQDLQSRISIAHVKILSRYCLCTHHPV